MRKMNGAIPKVEILDGNVGYIRINGVPMFDVSTDAISGWFYCELQDKGREDSFFTGAAQGEVLLEKQ